MRLTTMQSYYGLGLAAEGDDPFLSNLTVDQARIVLQAFLARLRDLQAANPNAKTAWAGDDRDPDAFVFSHEDAERFTDARFVYKAAVREACKLPGCSGSRTDLMAAGAWPHPFDFDAVPVSETIPKLEKFLKLGKKKGKAGLVALLLGAAVVVVAAS